MSDPTALLSGAVAMAYTIAALFFLRFWMRARDTLFLSFAAAFGLLAANQALVGLYGDVVETEATFYSLRLIGFVLIIIAIVRKNLSRR
jgi:hypothetical protein